MKLVLIAAIVSMAAGSASRGEDLASNCRRALMQGGHALPSAAATQRPARVGASQLLPSVIAGQHAKAGSQISPMLQADERWIGRAVHSSDGKYLGEVAALNEDDPRELYIDIGGFLAMGETRISISLDELQEVRDDRIVLRMTEPDARNVQAPDGNEGEDL
jgi:hypothetical protein